MARYVIIIFLPLSHYSSRRRPCATLRSPPRERRSPGSRPNAVRFIRQRYRAPRRAGCRFRPRLSSNSSTITSRPRRWAITATFLVEHHFTGFGQVSATLNLLTWVAAQTTTLRLGTAVMVLPWHNPVLLAEQAATVDLLSGGRLDFGVGKGYRHNEFAGFRIPMEEADARFEELLDIITKSWTSNEALLASRQILAVRRHHRRAADHPEAAPAVLDGAGSPLDQRCCAPSSIIIFLI